MMPLWKFALAGALLAATASASSEFNTGCKPTTGAFALELMGKTQADMEASGLGYDTDGDASDEVIAKAAYECMYAVNNNTVRDVCWQKESDFDTGDVAWMLCATTFVMLQTPATGFAQGGLVRRRNAMSVIGQSFMGVVIGCILWYAFGYSLTFGPSCNGFGCTGDNNDGNNTIKGFIGNIDTHAFFKDVHAHKCGVTDTIPDLLFAAFQMTFALMVPVLVTGAWAEKFHFSSACMFMVVWPILVYYPTAHWIWGGGFMSGWGSAGVLDYAGGIVIHTSSGVSAFVVALMLQTRRDFKKSVDTTHNLPLSLVGVSLVWVGWYSFNGGSGLRANGQAIGALVVTQISACFSASVWAICSKIHTGYIPVTAICSGALAGLAGITPASGYVLPIAGVPIGILVGLSSFYGGMLIKSKVKLDDVLDVTSLQAFPGAVGSILVGFFATTDAYGCEVPIFPGKACNRGSNEGLGLFYGGSGELLGYQTLAVLIQIVWSAGMTYVTMQIVKHTVGGGTLDVSADFEDIGLDLAEHGEKAYDLDGEMDDEEEAHKAAKLCATAQAGDLEELQLRIRKFGVHPRIADLDGRTCLHVSAREGHMDIVTMLCEEYKVDVNQGDNAGRTALNEAVDAAQNAVIQYLKTSGAQLSNDDIGNLLAAASKGDEMKVAGYIGAGIDINGGDYDDRTALHLAASEGHTGTVALLLQGGANVQATDVFGKTPIDDAGSKNVELRNMLQQAAQGNTNFGYIAKSTGLVRASPSSVATDTSTMELLTAAKGGDLQGVKRLHKKRANLNAADYDGRTALHQAAEHGCTNVVEYLLKQKGIQINALDHTKMTPLACAVLAGRDAAIQALQARGGKLEVEGATICEYAAKGNVAKLSALLDAKVDPNTPDYDGRTAMHVAASRGNADVIRLLARNNANANAKDKFGGTPLDDAVRKNHANCCALIEGYGGGRGSGSQAGAASASAANVYPNVEDGRGAPSYLNVAPTNLTTTAV